jgi:outer membrane protein TolC
MVHRPPDQLEFPNVSATRARIAGAEASAQAALAQFDGVVLGALRDLFLTLGGGWQ